MISDFLRRQIQAGRSSTLELLSSSVGEKKILENVCAFANSGGGTVLIGDMVSVPAGRIDDPKSLTLSLSSHITTQLSPVPLFVVSYVDDIGAVTIDISASGNLPYTFDGRVFIREGTTTRYASGSDISAMLDKNRTSPIYWETQRALGFGLKDLDIDRVFDVAHKGQSRNLVTLSDRTDIKKTLKDLRMGDEFGISNAAFILFGKAPESVYPQVRVRGVVYRDDDDDNGETLLDHFTFGGNAFETFEICEKFLSKHNPVRARPIRKWTREDQPMYPVKVLREALLNAIMHRDYSSQTGGIKISIYPSRIEFWNFGSLPDGMTLADLNGVHPSRPNNPHITYAFLLCGYIDNLGRGAGMILDQLRELGLPNPEWVVDSNGVTLTLYGEQKLSERQVRVIVSVKFGESITTMQYIERSGSEIKERQARKDLKELVEAGYFELEGAGPSTRYRRTDKMYFS